MAQTGFSLNSPEKTSVRSRFAPLFTEDLSAPASGRTVRGQLESNVPPVWDADGILDSSDGRGWTFSDPSWDENSSSYPPLTDSSAEYDVYSSALPENDANQTFYYLDPAANGSNSEWATDFGNGFSSPAAPGNFMNSTGDPWSDGAEVQDWEPQILPSGFIYPSYLAGRKEPRLASIFTYDNDYGWLWDITLGGRVPLFRFGTVDPIEPEGFQIDMEGAALLRLDFERDRELAATDYRAGLPIAYGTKHWQYKFGYYHISSHLGDQYLLADFRKKVHYVRDELVLGLAYKPISAMRLYGEAGWAFNAGETTSPWEFQFGAEFSPVYDPGRPWLGAPFAALCGHLFEELDFSGYFNSQLGWQWRGPTNNRLRLGAEFYCGCDDQFQFHSVYQRKVGIGLWYDY